MRLPFWAKAGLITVALILIFRQLTSLTQLIRDFPLNDFSVYMSGVGHTLTGNPYTLKFFDYYNYPPAATLFFYPFTLLNTDTAETIFTLLSVSSLFVTVILLFKLTYLQLSPYWLFRRNKLRLFAIGYLLLRFSPTRLTLALGQINLIVLFLLILAYYLYRAPRSLGKVGAGVALGLAFVFKFTPAVLLLFFLLKKQWKIIFAFFGTVTLLHFLAILVFGWDLTYYYYTQVLPRLFFQTGFYTMQRTYMNQSLTAFLGRLGIFDLYHTFIKLAVILPLLWLLCRRRLDFTAYILFIVFMTIFLPTFAWQHHYVFLIPALFLLGIRNLSLGILSYLLLTVTISANFPRYPNPFVHSHLFLSAAAMFALMFVARPQSFPGHKLTRRKRSG